MAVISSLNSLSDANIPSLPLFSSVARLFLLAPGSITPGARVEPRVEPEPNTTLNSDEVRLDSFIRDLVLVVFISVAFKQRGLKDSSGWNILIRKMLHFFPCYLFGRNPIGRVRSDTFTTRGFNSWRKVNGGKVCPFVTHEVQEAIRDEIGTAKFYLIADGSQDESKKEQMAIVVRFVYRSGYIKEIFLDLVHVKDTNALTLKNEILASLSHLKLDVQDIRGQDYDGASNMRGEWNGLKALIFERLPFCPYMCIAALINCSCSSTKLNDQLQDAQLAKNSHLAEIGELDSGRGANQMQNLQRPGDTRWSSHFKSICSLLKLFGPTRVCYFGSKKSFNTDDMSKLVTKYYPLDFTKQERIEFKLELQHFELDSDPELKNVSSLSALCRGLQKTKKSKIYPLIDRLIRLILTLPISMATSERAFSKIKLVKTTLRSTMSDDFLKSSMIFSIEREIVGTLCNEKIIDDFYSKSQRRVQMMKKRKVTND
ncbi:zinc finger MYM-type protein 1-like protein [Tanacetum coccineum]